MSHGVARIEQEYGTIKRSVERIWKLLKWGVACALVAALAGAVYVYGQIDEEIRRECEGRFARHYEELDVQVRSARLVRGEGIEVRGLSIADPRMGEESGRLVFLDELVLACDAEFKDLVRGEVLIEHMLVKRPEIRVTRRPDGSWSTSGLFPLPKLSERPPQITVENGQLELIDQAGPAPRRLTLRGLNLQITPGEPRPDGSRGAMRIAGSLAGDHMQRIEVEGTFDPEGGAWSLEGRIDGLELSPELKAKLPGDLAARLAELGTLHGQVTMDFSLRRDPAMAGGVQFDVSGRLERGSLIDTRLPFPLTEMWAEFRVKNDGFTVRELTASSGPTRVRLSASGSGTGPGSSIFVRADVEHLELDEELFRVLPDSCCEVWPKFRPTGTASARLEATYDGSRWEPELDVRLDDLAFTYYRLPYRLEHGQGTLRWENDQLALKNFKAYSGSHEIAIDCEVARPGPDFSGWVDVRGDGVPLDAKLLAALPEKSRGLVSSLNPHGSIDFALRLAREPGSREEPKKHLWVTLNGCSLKFDRFPYPLDEVRGRLECRDKEWTIRGLEGVNDTARVTCNGTMLPTGEGSEIKLRIDARDLPLEQELRDALKPRMRRLWNNLAPQGTVDVVCDVVHRTPSDELSVELTARPVGETTSLEPRFFPYRLERVKGTVTYRDGHVEMRNMRAAHDHVTLATDGFANFEPGGHWHTRLENLTIERLHADRDLVRALPSALKTLVSKLDPGGLMNVRGAMDLYGTGAADDHVRTQWNLSLDFHQGSLHCGPRFDNLHGGITVVGGSDGRRWQAQGELNFDHMTLRRFQFTELRGPFWVDDETAMFGAPASRRISEDKPRKITARVCGGKLSGDCLIRLGQTPTFVLNTRIDEPVDLGRCAREVFPGRQRVSGKVFGLLNLHGTAHGLHTLGGNGQVALREANVYELPVMVSLLKLISARPPDPTAFTTSDIHFRVESGHVYFDTFNFNGDAISLEGTGWMKPDTQIGLRFRAVVGRNEMRLPVISDVLGGASEQIMQIRVTGTLDAPEVRRDVLPGVNQALEQLQQELNTPSTPLPPPERRLPTPPAAFLPRLR